MRTGLYAKAFVQGVKIVRELLPHFITNFSVHSVSIPCEIIGILTEFVGKLTLVLHLMVWL